MLARLPGRIVSHRWSVWAGLPGLRARRASLPLRILERPHHISSCFVPAARRDVWAGAARAFKRSLSSAPVPATETEAGGGQAVEFEACAGTVELYHQHILVFTVEEEWPAVLENRTDGIPICRTIVETLKRREREGLNNGCKYKVGAIKGQYQELSKTPGGAKEGVYDVVLFPCALRFQITADDVEELVESSMAFSTPFSNFAPPPDGRLVGEPLEGEKHLLVCVHGTRDPRCGEIGPQLISSLQESLAALGDSEHVEDVRVHAVSHVGGHKFAANLVVYPQGDWYAPSDARASRAGTLALHTHETACRHASTAHTRNSMPAR